MTEVARHLFTPKGDRAQWEIVYDLLARLDVGDVLTYDDICTALDVDDVAKVRTPIRKAEIIWGEEKHRALAPVRKHGYRVVTATEHEMLARKQHKKGRRAFGRSQNLIQRADRSQLSPADRERFDRFEMQLARQQDFTKRIDLRQQKFDKTLQEHREQLAQQQEDHASAAERIARMETVMRQHGLLVEEGSKSDE